MSTTEPAAKKSRYLLTDWNPNDESKWDSKLAWRTLWITTYSLILAFCVWFLPSAIAPKLTLLGFNLDKSQLYWLTALPGLAAGILRLVYMFLPRSSAPASSWASPPCCASCPWRAGSTSSRTTQPPTGSC